MKPKQICEVRDLPRSEIIKIIEQFIKKGYVFTVRHNSLGINYEKFKLVDFKDKVKTPEREFHKGSPRARQFIYAWQTKKPVMITDVMGQDWHTPDDLIVLFEYSLEEKIKKLMEI